MMWTSQHDILLCREILLVEPYNHKPSTRERGQAWDTIAGDLNCITEVVFNVSKRSVRDRYNLLLEKFKKQERYLQRASGIEFEEDELDQLLRELVEKTQEAAVVHEKNNFEKKLAVENDKAAALDQRNKAMESLGETKKRKSLIDDESPQRKSRSTGSETLTYLREKAERDQEMRQEDMRFRREENASFRELLVKINDPTKVNNLCQQVENQEKQQQLLLLQQQRMMEQQTRVEQLLVNFLGQTKK